MYDVMKFDHCRAEGRGLSRKHIIESVQASLVRLQLSYIDIVMIHKVDPMCPMEGSFLASLVQLKYAIKNN